MKDLTEKTLSSKTLYRGRIVNVRVDEIELPSGNRSTREVVEHPGAVAVIANDDRGRIVLVRQFRYPAGEALLEIPAGKLDPGESPEDCARREMLEETGFSPGRLELLGRVFTTPGFSNEVIYIYRGYDLDYRGLPKGSADPDEEENLLPVFLHKDEAVRKIESGEINDSKTIIAILWP